MCKCHNCGEVVPIKRGNLIRTAQNPQSSCGCLVNREHSSGGTNLSRIKTKKPSKNSKTGINGVSKDCKGIGYRARLDYYGKRYEIGNLPSIEAATLIRKSLENEVLGNRRSDESKRLAKHLREVSYEDQLKEAI